MTAEEALRALQALRYSDPHQRIIREAPSMYAIADRAGVSRNSVYRIAGGQHVSKPIRNRVLAVVPELLLEYGDQDARAPTPARAAETPKTSDPIVKYVRFR